MAEEESTHTNKELEPLGSFRLTQVPWSPRIGGTAGRRLRFPTSTEKK